MVSPLIAGFLGMLQGLLYFVISLTCIVKHFSPQSLSSVLENVFNSNRYYFWIYQFFLAGNDRLTFNKQILTPDIFLGFMIVYLILHFVWMGLSTQVICNKSQTKLWGVITILVCILDLITVILLGKDFHECKNDEDWTSIFKKAILNRDAACEKGILPVLVVAAKGFLFWIINFILACNMLVGRIRVQGGLTYQGVRNM